jgi:hypothetical protein
MTKDSKLWLAFLGLVVCSVATILCYMYLYETVKYCGKQWVDDVTLLYNKVGITQADCDRLDGRCPDWYEPCVPSVECVQVAYMVVPSTGHAFCSEGTEDEMSRIAARQYVAVFIALFGVTNFFLVLWVIRLCRYAPHSNTDQAHTQYSRLIQP